LQQQQRDVVTCVQVLLCHKFVPPLCVFVFLMCARVRA
jgi:hypothetical protein